MTQNLSSQDVCADFRGNFAGDKAKFRRNTVCILREHLKAQDKRGKEDGASEVSEEVYYTRVTPEEAEALDEAEKNFENGEYVTDDEINWN